MPAATNLRSPTTPRSPRKPANECERQAAIAELLATEEKFHDEMSKLKAYFEKPLLEIGYLTMVESAIVFSNIGEIIDCSAHLLSALNRRRLNKAVTPRIGDILRTQLKNMEVYATYCSCLSASRELLVQKSRVPEFSKFIKVGPADGIPSIEIGAY